jgi:exosortase K
MRLKPTTIFQLGFVLLIALALKFHYSTASVNELRWILAPTTFLVETITGTRFTFESYSGYMSNDRTFLIAASCSGLNFLIIAFLMLSLGRVWRDRNARWSSIPLTLLAAYVATIGANTLRIVIARELDLQGGSLTADEVHRLEGIVVYFGSLLIVYAIDEKLAAEKKTILARQAILPLAIYYAITIAIPLARGSYREPGFAEHMIVVVLAPLMMLIPIVVIKALKNRRNMKYLTPDPRSF